MEVSLSRLNDIIHVSFNRICLGIGVGRDISYTACTAQSKKNIIIVITIIIPGKQKSWNPMLCLFFFRGTISGNTMAAAPSIQALNMDIKN